MINALPKPVTVLLDELTSIPSVHALVLGGSHALGTNDENSDWDLGLYYRGEIDLARLSALGTVYPPGSWGRIMNGGAWLDIGGLRVDVLLRDLEAVEHWTRRAEEGEFEVDSLLGYVAGIPTYTLTAELASCHVLLGEIPSVEYPAALSASAPSVWRFCRDFSLEYARKHAARGNVAGAIGNASRAVMEEAHATMCERREWVCNEKRLIDSVGLGAVQDLFVEFPSETAPLLERLERIAGKLGVASEQTSP